MLSGSVRASSVLWVTTRIVASVAALTSTISWARNAVRTGSRPLSGSSQRISSGSRTSARASPARLRIPPGDLARQQVLGALEPDHLELLVHAGRDLALAHPGVLAQREGDVVEEADRAEERAVLEQHPERAAHPLLLRLGPADHVDAVDLAAAGLGPHEPHHGLEEDRLAGAGGTEQRGDLAPRQAQRDVAPDVVTPEALGQPTDLDGCAHDSPRPSLEAQQRTLQASAARPLPPTRRRCATRH